VLLKAAKALRYIDVSALYSEIDEVRQFKETYAKLIDQVAEICEPSAIDETLKELKVKLTRAEDDREALGRTMTGLQTQLNNIEQLSRETRSMLAQMLLMGRGQPPKP
jgi:septal ring factor EnvC (AmiA/AmiB activator)